MLEDRLCIVENLCRSAPAKDIGGDRLPLRDSGRQRALLAMTDVVAESVALSAMGNC
jgi:hypothetical protein